MSSSDITPQAIRDVLTRFGALRPQFPANWTGEVTLHPSLTRFYEEVGPYGLTIPTTGNPFEISSLARLWDLQAGYRWHSLSGERLTNWRDE